MDYLKNGGDFHKYDHIRSVRMYGEHARKVRFSIVIPTYRRADLLEKSLRSALNQKMVTDFEMWWQTTMISRPWKTIHFS